MFTENTTTISPNKESRIYEAKKEAANAIILHLEEIGIPFYYASKYDITIPASKDSTKYFRIKFRNYLCLDSFSEQISFIKQEVSMQGKEFIHKESCLFDIFIGDVREYVEPEKMAEILEMVTNYILSNTHTSKVTA